MSAPSGNSGAPSQKKGPKTVASVGVILGGLALSAAAPRACSKATTSMEMPSVSDSKMNSWRFSSHILPQAVRNSMAVIHSSGWRSTSCTKAWACLTSEVSTCLKRASGLSAMRWITASARSLPSNCNWVMVLSLAIYSWVRLACAMCAPEAGSAAGVDPLREPGRPAQSSGAGCAGTTCSCPSNQG